jgi:hypothetical protein
VVGDADSGGAEHLKVVGAVAYRHGLGEGEAVAGGEFVQGGAFGGAVEDGVGDLAGEGGAVVEQGVGAVVGEAELGGEAAGEIGEAAGDQGADRTVCAHGGDQGGRTGSEFGCLPGGFEGGEGQAAEEGDALDEGGGEIDLAVHAARGDGGDFGF